MRSKVLTFHVWLRLTGLGFLCILKVITSRVNMTRYPWWNRNPLASSRYHLFFGPPEGVFQLFDALQTVLESGLIGLGMQRAASRIKLVTMLIVRLGGAYVSCQKPEVFIVKMQRSELVQHRSLSYLSPRADSLTATVLPCHRNNRRLWNDLNVSVSEFVCPFHGQVEEVLLMSGFFKPGTFFAIEVGC